MIITILFSIFTVYNSPFFRPSGRRRAVGGAHAVDRARVPRTDGLRATAGLQENGFLQVGETRRGGRRGPPRVSSSMSAVVLSGRRGL
jgi:hypothetical protein